MRSESLRECGEIEEVVEIFLPGASSEMVRLRRGVCGLARDPLARGALILGPAGLGKSSMARLVALVRYLAVLTPDRRREFLIGVRIDQPGRIDHRSIPWFVEFALPGLVPSVAEAQLFGYASEVTASGRGASSPGIFERAARGNMPDGEEELPDGARVTRGVVLLDEIADLAEALQPKLLAVLTGTPMSRVGAEGRGKGFVFEGLVLAATWKDLSVLRPDLRQRLSDHVLSIPSLATRRDKVADISREIVADLARRYERWLDGMRQVPGTIAGLDKTRLEELVREVGSRELSENDQQALVGVDWSAHGELRGLIQLLRRWIRGGAGSIEDLVAALPMSPRMSAEIVDVVLEEFERQAAAKSDATLTSVMKDIERQLRDGVVGRLKTNGERRDRLCEARGQNSAALGKQLHELGRSKGRSRGR